MKTLFFLSLFSIFCACAPMSRYALLDACMDKADRKAFFMENHCQDIECYEDVQARRKKERKKCDEEYLR